MSPLPGVRQSWAIALRASRLWSVVLLLVTVSPVVAAPSNPSPAAGNPSQVGSQQQATAGVPSRSFLDWLLVVLERGAVISAALVAVWGINAWRTEHLGRLRIDLAEEVLCMFYETEDAIRRIRCEIGFSGEGKSRKSEEEEPQNEKRIRDQGYVPIERYNQYKELFARMFTRRYRFKVHFGPEAEKPFLEIDKVINRVFFAAGDYTAACLHLAESDEYREEAAQDRQKAEAVIRERLPDDEIATQVREAVEAIEAICAPVVQRETQKQK